MVFPISDMSVWYYNVIMHIVSKFQIFIHIFTVVKPKNKNLNYFSRPMKFEDNKNQ